jgi:hypothetical protein
LDIATVNKQAEKAGLAELPVLVRELVDLLGGQPVAALGGAKQTRTVGAWIRGESEPHMEVEQRLRLAAKASAILASRYKAAVVKAWFLGANHWLDDEMPLAIIAKKPTNEIAKNVLDAARAAIAL